MKASVLFGAGWENDSVEVLWRDAGRVFCRLWRNDAEGEKHAFIPIPSDAGHPILESVNRLAHEFELRESPGRYVGIAAAGIGARARTDDARGRLHRRRAARSPDPRSRWRSDSFSDSPWRCLAQLVSYTDAG